jgi:hypothetical protein
VLAAFAAACACRFFCHVTPGFWLWLMVNRGRNGCSGVLDPRDVLPELKRDQRHSVRLPVHLA